MGESGWSQGEKKWRQERRLRLKANAGLTIRNQLTGKSMERRYDKGKEGRRKRNWGIHGSRSLEDEVCETP